VKVKKTKSPLKAGITVEEFGENVKNIQKEMNKKLR
jgi:hypothetical protein